ncbi:MAG: gliding motility-associated protein GldE [Lewinellaceae bacterium]|nr:gliding motility-associated protein GldE [Lewinellaceae bacterium]
MEPDLSESYHLLLILIQISPLIFLDLFIVVLLLFGSALISGSEIAYFSLGPNEQKLLQEENSPISKRIIALLEKPRRLLATILILNNTFNIAIVLLANHMMSVLFSDAAFDSMAQQLVQFISGIGMQLDAANMAVFIKVLVTVVLVTFILVLFGEITPKIYANIHNVGLARFMAKPLTFMSNVLAPVSTFFVNFSKGLEKRLARNRQVSLKADIDHAIELTVRQDPSSDEEVDMLKSIVKFSEVSVTQVMRSRMDVVAVEHTISYKDLLKTVKDSGFSRLPVYEEDLDHILGILYVKDLLQHLHEGEDYDWLGLVRKEVLYTPESRKINELLKDFQSRKLHMAIVVDEFGGTLGLATLEDIMEEVIGDIRDEFDDKEELEYIQLDEQNFIFEGKTLINDVIKIVGLDIGHFDNWRDDADSLAGLILQVTGQIPKVNREISFPHFKLKVLSVSKRRIEKVQLTKI